MKIITNKKIVQKIIIAIVIVILTTFCIPIQSHADTGGKLMNPIINFVAAVFDGVQHLLESTMLGKTQSFMEKIATDYKVTSVPNEDEYDVLVTEFMDAKFWGIDAINIPTITYTPEEIFSNKVPALDINFINPSIIKSADGQQDAKVQEKNVALQLRGTIAGWYNVLTIIAMVGLLSVLVYLGIRMLLSSIAADRAKYKQMLMDWVIAMCLLFTLHFIMSFALTMVETVTAMLAAGEDNTSITVYATNVQGYLISNHAVKFETNLMSYVRFMIQAGDLSTKLGFVGLYIMLVIYSVRFTWVYLKRVINMAFLTLIAPMVALTYPIDKVSDGKAQAFNMWLKEFTYNALIQPIHLLLYKILLGSAINVAADNPLYAIAALGFIIAAEKMVKQMFGFSKAAGGTVASMAGAAGVTALASKLLNGAGKKAAGSGGNGKVRTKDVPEREGKDNGANKPFDAISGRNPEQLVGARGTGVTPTPDSDPVPSTEPNQQQEEIANATENPYTDERLALEEQLAQYDSTDPFQYMMDPEQQELQRRYQELREAEASYQSTPENNLEDTKIDVPSPEEYNNPFNYQGPLEPDNFFDVVGKDVGGFANRQRERLGRLRDGIHSVRTTVEGRRNLKNKIKGGLNNAAIAAWKSLPAVGYKAARGTARGLAAAGMGLAALPILATTGSGEQTVSGVLGSATVGLTTGDNIFDAAAKKVGIRNPGGIIDTYKDAYGTTKYGNAIDARNAKADKEYVRSSKFDDFYEKEIKGKYSYTKEQFKEIATSYRKAGITEQSDIRKAMKLENYYQRNNPNSLNETDIRAQVQNIVAGYKSLDSSQMKAFSGDKKAEEALRKELLVMLGGDTPPNRAYVDTIYQGYKDYRTQT